ncbi:MAG TPA: heme exporter protein CcmD [Stellaceae bacterium]|nr:heme exporter protein CcmD [Stellaceae bacterium]
MTSTAISGFQHWLAMGGYAAFVWPAYGVTAAVLGVVAAQSWRRYQASIRELDRLQRANPDR